MIPGLEQRPMPEWLRTLDSIEHFPLQDILPESLYYPACGLDGWPVQYIAGFCHSFIYVDNGYPHDDLLAVLDDPQEGFWGYHALYRRDVSRTELAPDGWPLPDPRREENQADQEFHPYAVWVIYERDEAKEDCYGPKRLSFLYLCEDGVEAFNALYLRNNTKPEVITIKLTGWSGNWTTYEWEDEPLGQLAQGNPSGPPTYLLGGAPKPERDINTGCWHDYSVLVHQWHAERRNGERSWSFGLWQREQ